MALLHGRAGRLTAQNGCFWRGQEESKATHAANKAALVKAIGAVSDTSAPLVAYATARVANSGGPRGRTGPLGTPSIRLTAARAACLAHCGAARLSCSSSVSACPRPRAGTRQAAAPTRRPSWGSAATLATRPCGQRSGTGCVASARSSVPVRAALGRLSALSVFLFKSVFYGAFCMGAQGAQQPKTAVSGPGSPRQCQRAGRAHARLPPRDPAHRRRLL